LAAAQQIGRTGAMLDLPDGNGERIGIDAGPFTLLPSAEARLEYDSNIYAEPDDPDDDLIAVISPRVEARLAQGQTQVALRAEATGRKYFDHTAEDSLAGLAGALVTFGRGSDDQVSADVRWQRVIEDRGDPEARDSEALGPRKLDIFASELGWRHGGPRLSLAVRGGVDKINYLAPIDEERDLTNYAGRVSLGFRISGAMEAVLLGFGTHRDFRLRGGASNLDRDATTMGARAGLAFGESGIIRGEASVGVFQLSPEDPRLESRTGLSAEAALAYLPSRRLAITLNAFQGNVATVRTGAQSRTDTVIQLGVQAEARANFRLEGSLFYRRSAFIGTDVAETTGGVRGEAEYRLNPRLSLVGAATFSKRDSDIPSDRFERLRGALELRVRL
jgi:hypothetical protein